MAFHPDYANNGKFYVNVTVDNGGVLIGGATSPFSTHIREYTVSSDPNVADPASMREILSYVQPQSNHNAGWIGFSPVDRHLYVSSGDGGGVPSKSRSSFAIHQSRACSARSVSKKPSSACLLAT